MPELHNPYIQWNPIYEMFSIFHNGGIHAYDDHRTPLWFDTYSEAAAYLADPTGRPATKAALDAGMHDGCPCKASGDSGAGE
jgi:hypothetical protein